MKKVGVYHFRGRQSSGVSKPENILPWALTFFFISERRVDGSVV